MQPILVDNYHRRFQYLRLSLTELCNFKCQYCLPNGYQHNAAHHFLAFNEIKHVLNAFTELGMKKVRLTGGEPTLRRDFLDIVSLVASYPQISEVAVTTNGTRLIKQAQRWRNAGLTAINISVDSFSPRLFHLITGENKLAETLQGVDKAIEVGIPKVKVNTVLMKGVNDNLHDYLLWLKDRPVELRFIELMETGEGSAHFQRYHLSGAVLEQQLIEQGWLLQAKQDFSGPAKVYYHHDYCGKIGLIMPYSKDFCLSCNRLRVSSLGKLHYCLFGESAIDLRDLIQQEQQKEQLKANILASLKIKPETHFLHQHKAGMTKNLSFIGG